MSARAPDAGAGVALRPGLLGRVVTPRRDSDEQREGQSRTATRAGLWGRLALGVLLLSSFAIVLVAAGQPTVLVPRSNVAFPDWFSGPLHPLGSGISLTGDQLNYGFSALLVVMAIAYVVVLRCAAALGARVAIGAVVALHLVWLLVPLMPLTDVFNYIGYARLGALHGINPYAHGIGVARHDPVNLMTTWHDLRTPYGPLFTVMSYALAPLPLPLAYWLLKLTTVAASLGCVALVWRCARQLGRPPVRPMLFFAANPLVLVYGLGAFHNDMFMLLPILAGVTLLLGRADGRRSAAAGAAFVVAAAVKASAAILLPFGLIAARRRGRFLAAAAVAGALTVALSTVVFGFALPNLGDQSTLLSSFSVPNTLGHLVGLGGAPPWLLAVAKVAVVVVVLWLSVRVWQGRIEWIAASGWATLALILSLSWSLPSYVVWLAPLAALARSRALRRATLVLSLYLLLTVLPVFGMGLEAIHYKPMDSAVGRASVHRMNALQR